MQKVAKVQHYVPQFLLRYFGAGKKHHVRVFDKRTERIFTTHVRNVAGETGFYNFSHSGDTFSIEPWLAKLESEAKSVVAGMLERDSLSNMSAADRATMAAFLAVQFTRTRHFRIQWSSLPGLLAEHLRARGDSLAPELGDYLRTPDENQTVMETAKIVSDAPLSFGPHFLSKVWILFRTTRNLPLIVGDNPLVLQNTIDRSPHGNLGLAVQGIEIYLPLSPTRALGCLCASLIETIAAGAQRFEALQRVLPAEALASHKIRQMAAAIQTGTPVDLGPANVLNLNSLQVKFSERYLFCSVGDFALAREMITSHPELRSGPRFQVG
jgi:hypothetical protein